MTGQWIDSSFGEVALFINGAVFGPNDWKENGIPIIRIEQINDPSSQPNFFQGVIKDDYSILAGDIIFSWSGTIKAVVWTGRAAVLNQHLFKVVPKSCIHKCFLFHLLDFHTESLANSSHGTTMRHIKRGDLHRFEIHLPPLPEQRAIAEVLDTVDTAIRRTEDLIRKLQATKKGMLHDLLTRGVDAHGQLRPSYAEAPRLYKESPLGWIPKEWEVKSIDELASHVGSGITPTGGSNVYQSSGVMFIRSQNVHFDGLKLDDVAYITNGVHHEMSRSEIFHGDVLLNITGASIGRCCVMPLGHVANTNQHVCAIRLTQNIIADAFWLCECLASHIGQKQIYLFNAGGNRDGLNYQSVRRIRIPWPNSNHERKDLVDKISLLKLKIIAETESVSHLKNVKSGLMTDLLTGKVRTTSLLRAKA